MNHKVNSNIKILLVLLLVGCSCTIARAQSINDAVHRGDVDLVRRMLRANSRLARFRGADSSTPLHWAAWDGRADIARMLVEAGADVNDRRALEGGTPLWLAGWQGHTDVVTLLLEHGADPEIRSNDGNTPLHEAAAYGHTDTVERFLMAGQNRDTLNKEGDTPLGVAAVWGRPETAKRLIGFGADIQHRNNQGQTILDVAMAHQHEDCAELIRDYQAALDARAARDLARKSSNVIIHTGFQNWSKPNLQQKKVYNTEFEASSVGAEWSTQSLPGAQQAPMGISVTPLRGRRFLGEFGSQAVRLTLAALPPHTEASVYFDLYIIRSWDGNDLLSGPDVFTLSVVGGPSLLQTTFCNPYNPERRGYITQAYPGEYAGDHHVPHTGAVEVDTLGFTMPVNGVNTIMDSAYEISYTFTHHGSDLAIDFAAQGLEALDNESWGITNVQVIVAGTAPTPVLTLHNAPDPFTHIASHVTPRRANSPKPRAATHRATASGKKPIVARSPHPAARLHPKEKPPGL